MSKNKLGIILSLILILLVCSILVQNDQAGKSNTQTSKPASATVKNENKNIVKAYTEPDYTYIKYTVKPGDGLFSLGKKYMPTYQIEGVIKEIKEKNDLKSDTLQVNSTITIPAEKAVIGKN